MVRRVLTHPFTLAALAVLGLGLAWPWIRGARTEEDRVAAVLAEVIEGIERRYAGDVMEHLSRSYRDAHGFTRHEVYRWMVGMFFRRRGIRVQRLGPTTVELSAPDRAVARFTAAVSEGVSLDALREAGVWRVEVGFVKEDGAWRIAGHRRRRLR